MTNDASGVAPKYSHKTLLSSDAELCNFLKHEIEQLLRNQSLAQEEKENLKSNFLINQILSNIK